MATIQRITAELGKLALLYRQSMPPAELLVLAEAWTEALEELGDEAFAAAVRLHMRRSRYFPCPADMLRAAADAAPVRPARIALDKRSPEELQRQCVCAAMLSASLRKDPRSETFFRSGDWTEREKIARETLGGDYPETGASWPFARETERQRQ